MPKLTVATKDDDVREIVRLTLGLIMPRNIALRLDIPESRVRYAVRKWRAHGTDPGYTGSDIVVVH